MEGQLGDEIWVQHTHPGAPLIIVFSSVNSNGFSFSKQFSDLSINKVFVRDKLDAWYQKGTGSYTTSVEGLAGKLSEIIASTQPSRTLTFGTSMGGYASILFGNLINVDAVIASSPQTLLDSRLPHTPSSDFSDYKYFDLSKILRSDYADRRHIVFSGADDLVDLYNISRAAWRQLQHIPVKGQDHLAAVLLTKKREFTRAIQSCIDGVKYEPQVDCDHRCFEEPLRRMGRKQIEAQYLTNDVPRALRIAKMLATSYPEWAAPYQATAELHEHEGNLDRAIVASKRGASLAPTSVTITNLHATLLLKAGRFNEAIKAFEVALRVRPKHYAGLCGIATALAKTGKTNEALPYLDRAIEIRPRLTRAASIREDITSGRSEFPVHARDEDM